MVEIGDPSKGTLNTLVSYVELYVGYYCTLLDCFRCLTRYCGGLLYLLTTHFNESYVDCIKHCTSHIPPAIIFVGTKYKVKQG